MTVLMLFPRNIVGDASHLAQLRNLQQLHKVVSPSEEHECVHIQDKETDTLRRPLDSAIDASLRVMGLTRSTKFLTKDS